jgi:hypothetical protein
VSDPVTIGLLVANAMGIAGKAALDGAVGAAVKDLYGQLKTHVAALAHHDVEALEKAPTSVARQAALAEVLDAQDPVALRDLLPLAQRLLAELERAAPVGVDIGHLKAMNVRLADIEVSAGVGFRADRVEAEGDFTLERLTAGSTKKKYR